MALANCGISNFKQENEKWYFDLIHPTQPTRRLAADTEQDAISWKHTIEWAMSLRDEALRSVKEGQGACTLTDGTNLHHATITQGPRGKGLGLEIKMRRDGSIYIKKVSDEAADKGVKANDTLVGINGNSLRSLQFPQVIEFVRSLQVGSDVNLELMRENLPELQSEIPCGVTVSTTTRGSRCTSIDTPVPLVPISTSNRRKSVGRVNFIEVFLPPSPVAPQHRSHQHSYKSKEQRNFGRQKTWAVMPSFPTMTKACSDEIVAMATLQNEGRQQAGCTCSLELDIMPGGRGGEREREVRELTEMRLQPRKYSYRHAKYYAVRAMVFYGIGLYTW
jgi:hypothetical protein